jgi:hypothetical protein
MFLKNRGCAKIIFTTKMSIARRSLKKKREII